MKIKGSIGVVGWGLSGQSTARWCKSQGLEVQIWDDNPVKRRQVFEDGWSTLDLEALDVSTLVLSPGVRLDHPLVVRARRKEIRVMGDLDLFAENKPHAPVIGVSGTNGKSTTVSLIGHIFSHSAIPATIGGNLGIPVFDLPDRGQTGWSVLEISSFQLEILSALRIQIAVLLNISPDHLDRHPDLETYQAIKAKIFQSRPDIAVIGIDDPYCRRIKETLTRSRVIPISGVQTVEGGVGVEDGRLIDRLDTSEPLDLSNHPRSLWQDIAAAYAVAVAAGVPAASARDAIQTFRPLPHRLEPIATVNDILYINDSKATNSDATAHALKTFPSIYWIVGGIFKESRIAITDFTNLKRAYLIGTSMDLFASHLDERRQPYTRCGTLSRAVEQATRDAKADGIGGSCVLLSPACASFDHFSNAEERGETFNALIASLKP